MDLLKNFLKKKENIFFLFIIAIIIFLDKISKLKIINNLNNRIHYVNEYINLDLTWNIGIGFGLLSTTSQFIYNLITLIIGAVIFIIFYMSINLEKIEKFAFSFIIGGALGNLHDRIIYKAVPDFIDIHYHNFHWFTFNLADIFITIGIIIYILKGLIVKE